MYDVMYIVIGNHEPQLDLHELVRRELKLELGLANRKHAVALAEIAHSVAVERLLTLDAGSEPMVKPKMYLLSSSWNTL